MGLYIGIVTGLITIAEKIDPTIRQDVIDLSKQAWENLQRAIPSIPTIVMPSPEMSCPGCGIQIPGDGAPDGSGDKPVTDDDYGICNEDEGNC